MVAQTTIIHADAVIVDADSKPLGKATVIVTDGKIASVQEGWTDGPEGADIVKITATGGVLAFGTDAGVFEHGRNGEEFGLMVAQGMSAREALASAATVAAKALRMEHDIGRIAPGYSADIIAVEGNPREDVTVLEDVDWVMARDRIQE